MLSTSHIGKYRIVVVKATSAISTPTETALHHIRINGNPVYTTISILILVYLIFKPFGIVGSKRAITRIVYRQVRESTSLFAQLSCLIAQLLIVSALLRLVIYFFAQFIIQERVVLSQVIHRINLDAEFIQIGAVSTVKLSQDALTLCL